MVEPIALDEAFLDVAGVRRVHGPGPDIARAIRARVKAETGLTVSVGVATTKLLAKLASDLAKPDGLLVVEPGTELGVLHPLAGAPPLGCGPGDRTPPRHARRRDRRATSPRIPEDTLVRTLGNASGHHLHALAWNRDERPVVADQEVKSIGHEETFPTDLHDHAALEHQLVGLADGVASRLRAAHAAARTVQLKVRFGDFKTITRSRTLRGTDRPGRRRRAGWPATCSGRWTSAPACACWASPPSSSCAGTRAAVRARRRAGSRAGRTRARSSPIPTAAPTSPEARRRLRPGSGARPRWSVRWTRSGPGSVLVP